MRKTYMMLLALVLTMMGTTSAMGQKIYRAELDKSMFKAWDGYGADAKEVADPEPIDDGAAAFGCEVNLYKQLNGGAVVYGNTNVYYLWYANLTGSKKMYIDGTAGLMLRILLNRPEPDGGDAHGGQTTELNVTLDADGKGEVDLSNLEYVHLNCVKLGWSSPAGVINSIEVEGTVRPVSGYLDLINNGDAEGTDLESFPVSHDGPNNGNTANDRPEIVEGGVDGGHCFKVVSDDNATETWSTQFYLKFDEALQEGDKWKLSMFVKADRDATITTSAQAQPRTWNGGFVEEFSVSTEWKKFEFSGTVDAGQANNGGFLSAAFDLNTDKDNANTFYFDNIVFQKDMGGANPLSMITTTYGSDVIRLDLANNTNMKTLVKNAGGKTLIYPNECGTVYWNGKKCNLMSIEGRPDGNLYLFLLDTDGEGDDNFDDEEAQVVVAFNNPADAEHQILFEQGKWKGEPLPEVSGLVCDFDYDLGAGDYYSYLWGAPEIEVAVPENGSFNLPADTKEFTIVFNQKVDVKSVKAKLERENLKVSPAEGASKEITLTRTATGNLAGYMELTISSANSENGTPLDEDIVLKYSFGKSDFSGGDQPQDLIDNEKWEATAANGIPENFIVNYTDGQRTSESTYGSGSRMFAFAEGGDFTKGLYFREGNVEYGTVEGAELTLEAGKKYVIRFKSAMWKDNGTQMTFQIESADDPENALFSQVIDNAPNVNGNTGSPVSGATSTEIAFVPEFDGNYVLRWISNGFVEVLLANPTVKYVPNVLGIEETQLLETALANAKSVREGNQDERYNGAAFTALDEAIKKYEAEAPAYTAPSSYKNASAALDAAAQAMKDHRQLCDAYDPLPAQAQEVIDNNIDSRFATTDLFKSLVSITAKYAETTKETVVDEETGEEYEVERTSAKVIKDDAALQTAVSELSDIITTTKNMFTEGRSTIWSSWEANKPGSGYCVLLERLRRGSEALQAFGVPEDNALIVEAANALSDDDKLAEGMKNRLKAEVYSRMKEAGNDMFEPTVDENTLEEVTPAYDMSVFVKNPNIYCLDKPTGFTEENVPGWTVPTTDKPGLYDNWTDRGLKNIPQDIAFSSWKAHIRMEQTVTDLPVGVYTVKFGAGSWNGNADWIEGGFCYVKTSDTPAVGEEEEEDLDTHFAGYSMFAEGQVGPESVGNHAIEGIQVTDGKLTFGVNFGANDQAFFNEVEVLLTGAIPGFDYGKAYEEVLTGVEAPQQVAKVRAIQLFDLNGRRINSAKKGVVIVKKQMSDGTIRTEKVLK